jgi:NAD(P)H-hydrate epimerase
LNQYSLIIDALLGFSYNPPLRDQYQLIINCFKHIKTPILSIDIPSGWNVEKGNTDNLFIPK